MQGPAQGMAQQAALTPRTLCAHFPVQAWNQVGCSEPGQVATFTTQATVPSQPDPPRPVAATPVRGRAAARL